MKVLKEITEWDSPNQLNHTYILNDKDRLIGYIPYTNQNVQWFTKPKSFSKTRRSFVEQPKLVKTLIKEFPH